MGTKQHKYQSWGRYPEAQHHNVHSILWRHEGTDFNAIQESVLCYAYGRSYGDSCLNSHEGLLVTKALRRFIQFDQETGILRCEAGTSFAEILDVFVPKGWFLPVTPGTKHVSVGGAIANDVHGKNHHRAGTFGCHVRAFELLRSTGERLICSPGTNPNLFQATIGGLGLTGVILWAEFQMKRVSGPWLQTEHIRFSTLDEFYTLSAESNSSHEYTVAWIDSLAPTHSLGRGIFIRGKHAPWTRTVKSTPIPAKSISIPCDGPPWLLNPWTMKIFNSLYYHKQFRNPVSTCEHFNSFFYPLDRLLHWNRLYGKRGFLQYQCLIPPPHEDAGILELLRLIKKAGQGSFLAVLKTFGDIRSPGLLSFPRPGTTLALDFPFLGDQTLNLLNELDAVVRNAQGAVYPAKDARMSSLDFQRYFPRLPEFLQFKDPKFSSSFWRRVAPETSQDHPEQPSSHPFKHHESHFVYTESAGTQRINNS